MKKIVTIAFLSVFVSGCASAKLSRGPDTFPLIEHTHSLRVGVPQAVDERGTNRAGTIGAAFIQVKSELADLTTNYLINYLNTRLNLNVERIQMAAVQDFATIFSQHNMDRVLIVKIKRLKMFSVDALMQPVEVDLDLECEVYDPSGNLIYRQTFMGHHEKRIGISIVDKTTGKLVEAAVLDAMNNLVKDPGLKKSLASAKTF